MNDIDGVSYCEVCNYFEGAFGCVDGACRKPAKPERALHEALATAYPDVPVVAPAECVPPASPPPPTENARAGADNECFGSCDRTLSPKRIAEGHTLCVWCQSLWDRAVAAGRARGIEEAAELVNMCLRRTWPHGWRAKIYYKALAIADAIAKETKA